MAGFTTALVLGAIAGGAFAGGKKLGSSQQKKADAATVAAPGPTNADTIAAPPAPAPAPQTASAGVKAGQQAAQKTRRKMAPQSKPVIIGGAPPPGVSTKMNSLIGY